MEKKTKVRKMVSGILTLACLVLIYPLLDVGDARQTNAAILNLADIAKHNTAGDCWLIINGKVYNVTDFLSSHSGGAASIAPYCGKDATAAFTGKPHPGSDLNVLGAYYIGDVATVQPAPAPAPAPLLPPPPAAAPAPQPLLNSSPILTKIVISPFAVGLKAGESKLFKAAAYDQQNKLMPGSAIMFSSSDEKIGSIDAGGLFRARSAGSVLVTASSGQIKSVATVNVAESQIAPDPVVLPDAVQFQESDLQKKRCEEIYGNHQNDDSEEDEDEDEADDFEDGSDDEYGERMEAGNIKNYSKNYYKM